MAKNGSDENNHHFRSAGFDFGKNPKKKAAMKKIIAANEKNHCFFGVL